MMRDKRKSNEYFEDYINYQNDRIAKFKSIADSLSGMEKNKREKCLRMIANFLKDLFAAKYSAGVSKTELRKIFDEYLEILKEIKTEEYAEYVDAIAIAFLLNVNAKDLHGIVENDKLNDGLVTTLIHYPDTSEKALQYPDYYQQFYDFILGKSNRESFKRYMTMFWYDSNKEFAWYDSDKSTEDIYVGYWCWLAAACLKLKKENSITDIPYIPYDLL